MKKTMKPKLTNGKTIVGYHVLRGVLSDNGKPYLSYGDHREVVKGQILAVDGALKLCRVGLHASKTEKQAIRWFFKAHPKARNPVWLCKVRLSGEILGPVDGKYCARARELLSIKRISPKEGVGTPRHSVRRSR